MNPPNKVGMPGAGSIVLPAIGDGVPMFIDLKAHPVSELNAYRFHCYQCQVYSPEYTDDLTRLIHSFRLSQPVQFVMKKLPWAVIDLGMIEGLPKIWDFAQEHYRHMGLVVVAPDGKELNWAEAVLQSGLDSGLVTGDTSGVQISTAVSPHQSSEQAPG